MQSLFLTNCMRREFFRVHPDLLLYERGHDVIFVDECLHVRDTVIQRAIHKVQKKPERRMYAFATATNCSDARLADFCAQGFVIIEAPLVEAERHFISSSLSWHQ